MCLGDTGIKEQVLAEAATRKKPMELDSVVNYIEAKENAKSDVAELSCDKYPEVNKVSEFQKGKDAQKMEGRKNAELEGKSSEVKKRCKFCRRSGHGEEPTGKTRQEKCRAWDKECRKCGKIGHCEVKCRAKDSKVNSNRDGNGHSEDEADGLVGSVFGAGTFCKINLECPQR